MSEMTAQKAKTNPALSSATEAVDSLCEDAFARLDHLSGLHAISAHSELKQTNWQQKSAAFYRSFLPLRSQMIALLANGYRMYFKLALAHRKQTSGDPNSWAWTELLPFVRAALEWMRDWYILACDGENQRVRTIATIEFVPGKTVSTPIPTSAVPVQPSIDWRAPTWLFGVSLVFFGISVMKKEHMPNKDSEERLGTAHSRLLLKGAKHVFLWELEKAIAKVRNEEIAAAGAIRVEVPNGQRRGPNKRKGFEQRLELYGAIRRTLSTNPDLEGMQFCAELDKRHAPPLFDWIKSGQWRKGLTWKEAWGNPDLRRKIRRVRQEAQKAS